MRFSRQIDFALLAVRNWWIDLQVRWRRPLFVPCRLRSGVGWDGSLFHWDEAFVSPCSLNERFCGGFVGRWTPEIQFMGGKMPVEIDSRMKVSDTSPNV